MSISGSILKVILLLEGILKGPLNLRLLMFALVKDLFFKYVKLAKFNSYLKRSDDKFGDCSTCKEVLKGEEYILTAKMCF